MSLLAFRYNYGLGIQLRMLFDSHENETGTYYYYVSHFTGKEPKAEQG